MPTPIPINANVIEANRKAKEAKMMAEKVAWVRDAAVQCLPVIAARATMGKDRGLFVLLDLSVASAIVLWDKAQEICSGEKTNGTD